MPLVELRDVIKLYKPKKSLLTVPALRGIDLKINDGELIAIIGPSGSGKTTLLRMISGLENPSSGTVEFAGQGDLSFLSPKDLNLHLLKNIGIIQQSPKKNLLPKLNSLDNICFPMKIDDALSRRERKQRANELLDAVGLSERKYNYPKDLSGGEAQRLSIATALANNPKLVIADEPTGELDTENTFKIIRYFRELNKDFGTTFVVVTHDNRFSNLTDKTFKIKNGRIYGLHRQIKSKNTQLKNVILREQLLFVDDHRYIKLPEDLCRELNIGNHVVVRIDHDKKVLEIIPVNE